MPIPSSITDLSATIASNSPAGSDSPTDGDNFIRALSAFIRQNYDRLTSVHVSVKDSPYSALGDGVTDDTSAIQAAIDAVEAAGGGIVYFPPGTYIVTATLAADDAVVHLMGAGVRATILQVNHTAGPAVQIKWYFSGISHMQIQGSAARLAASAGTNYGVFFPTDSALAQSRFGNYVRDCIVNNHPTHGIYLTGQGSVVEDSRILDVGGHGIYMDNFDAVTSLVAGFIEVKNTQVARATGHAVCGGVNRMVFRVVLENVDAFHCALTAGVRQSANTLHFGLAENIVVRSCGIGGWSGDSPSRVAAVGAVYVNGRAPLIENNRFVDVVAPAVDLGAAADGARVIDNHLTGEVQASLDPVVAVASGCAGVYVRSGFPTFITRLMTAAPDGSGNRAEMYDVSPQGYRSKISPIAINDDAVHTMTFSAVTEGIIALAGNSATSRGLLVGFRVGDGNAYAQHLTTQTGIVAATNAGAPTGTTGADGNLNIFADTTANSLHIENRRGAALTWMPTLISLMGGEATNLV